MHGRREGVVRGLAHIDVIVRVQNLFAGDFVAAICDNLVGVHVRLSAASRLPYDERKMVVQTARDNFVGRHGNILQAFVVEPAEPVVGDCRGLFQNTERVRDFSRHNFAADFEVLITSLSLRRPVSVGRDFHFAHRILFNTIIHHNLL